MTQLLYIFPINSRPLGVSFTEWSIKWWQWIASIPKDMNPAYDDTGQFVNLGQRYQNVTFLCQTFEGAKTIPTRRNTIKSNKYFFLPIMNWISVEGIDGKNDDELKAIAKSKMDKIDILELKINGKDESFELNKNRVNSDFFYVDLPHNNIFDIEQGRKKCISDGYWIFFKISSDTLTMSTNSICSSGINQIAVEYDLNLL